MSVLHFSKMHGLGNDFVVINQLTNHIELSKETIQKLAHRQFGIGFDQLLYIEKSQLEQVDFKYRIFNADGSEVEQCGNGARCFAMYLREKGLSDKDEVKVETQKGIIVLYHEEDGIKVNMGKANFIAQQIPMLTLPSLVSTNKVNPQQNKHVYEIQRKINQQVCDIRFAAVSVGNPHITIQVDDLANFPVQAWGQSLVADATFPQGINVGFMQIIDKNNIALRVYERGTGETLACGTGACAAVVNGIQQGVLNSQVQVQLNGGSLAISWQGVDTDIWMKGPACLVYEGTMKYSAF